MPRRGVKRRLPGIIYIREVSNNPGSPEELDRIMLRWEMALARKAKTLLDNELPRVLDV